MTRYVRSAVGRGALLSPRRDRASRHLSWMLLDTLRLGLPAGRRFGVLRSVLARLPDVSFLLDPVLGWGRPCQAGDLDAAVSAALSAGFVDAAHHADVEVVALPRGDGRLVLCFTHEPWPAVVGKLPATGSLAAERERAALIDAAGSGVAPRYLGEAGGGLWQAGLRGRPPRLPALHARHIPALGWPAALDAVVEGLVDLADATLRPGVAAEIDVLAAVERSALITTRSRQQVAAARRDLASLDRTVLRHNDLAPQNYLLHGGACTGFVDWETAVHGGVPGFDLWLVAVSYFEHALGIVRWSGQHLTRSFARAWPGPYFTAARTRLRRMLQRLGLDPSLESAITVGFFGYRVGRRLRRTTGDALGRHEAAAILEVVCRT